MLQENMVLHIKELINPESSHNLENYHRKTLTPLIMKLMEFKREMREDITGREWGGHHTRRDTKVDVRHLVGRMSREHLFRHTPDRLGGGSEDDTIKEAKDWVYEGQAMLEDGAYWNRFLSTSLCEQSATEEDGEEMAFEVAE
jgi:hypothetical protein